MTMERRQLHIIGALGRAMGAQNKGWCIPLGGVGSMEINQRIYMHISITHGHRQECCRPGVTGEEGGGTSVIPTIKIIFEKKMQEKQHKLKTSHN